MFHGVFVSFRAFSEEFCGFQRRFGGFSAIRGFLQSIFEVLQEDSKFHRTSEGLNAVSGSFKEV